MNRAYQDGLRMFDQEILAEARPKLKEAFRVVFAAGYQNGYFRGALDRVRKEG